MNMQLPNWLLVIAGIGTVIWIFAGIEVFRAAKEFRQRNGGGYLRFGLPPTNPSQNPPDDSDWWKRGG